MFLIINSFSVVVVVFSIWTNSLLKLLLLDTVTHIHANLISTHAYLTRILWACSWPSSVLCASRLLLWLALIVLRSPGYCEVRISFGHSFPMNLIFFFFAHSLKLLFQELKLVSISITNSINLPFFWFLTFFHFSPVDVETEFFLHILHFVIEVEISILFLRRRKIEVLNTFRIHQ